MCGILGSINIALNDEYLDLINHRGPDARGMKKYSQGPDSIYLGHTRLSIVDLSEAGSQPMVSACGNYTLIFNGEIYNHLELREKLPDVKFRGHSDTETILNFLIKFGTDGIKDFNGIFAFAFFNKKNGQVLLVRDPFGVKPIYYHIKNNKLIFSSEIRPILKYLPDQQDINYSALFQFLKLRYNMAPFTLFQHIEKLEPGHFLKISVHDFQIEKKYYSYLPVKNKDISENEALERYEDLLHKAIKRQLMADVPICVLLSGGVDSGLLTMIASKYYQGTFDTYTAGYDISDFSNELEDAQESACFFKTNHHDVIMKEKDFFPNFEKIINIIEEPLGSESIFPIFFLAEAITKDGYKVGLTGQGVDEPWGGYKRYSVQQLFDKYSFGPLYRFKGLSKFIKHEKYRRGVNSFLEKDKINKLIETYSIFDQRMIQQIDNGIFSPENQSALYDRLHEKIDLYHLQGMSQTDTMMMLDARMNLSDDLLLYTDKIAMHHSLELRVPYLDIELMQFVESIPAHMKVNLRNSKILHKKLSGKLLPDKIVNRNKKGFWTPRQLWFKSDAIDHIFEEMYETNSVFANYFNKNYVKNLIINHKAGKVNYEMQLYLLVILHYWFKLFGRG